MARGTHAAAILGPELYSRLPNIRILLVGAGGIGCELRESPSLRSPRDDVPLLDDVRRCLHVLIRFSLSLVKNIVMTGFGDITLLDLDTIDLSNLNRQFLFHKKDVKQSKALVWSLGYICITTTDKIPKLIGCGAHCVCI
jgi:ubiquitin-like 1-activating enzyme E1 B